MAVLAVLHEQMTLGLIKGHQRAKNRRIKSTSGEK